MIITFKSWRSFEVMRISSDRVGEVACQHEHNEHNAAVIRVSPRCRLKQCDGALVTRSTRQAPHCDWRLFSSSVGGATARGGEGSGGGREGEGLVHTCRGGGRGGDGIAPRRAEGTATV